MPADQGDAEGSDKRRQSHILALFHSLLDLLIGAFAKAVQLLNHVPVTIQPVDIGEGLDAASVNEGLQGCLGQTDDLHVRPGTEVSELPNLLGRTVLVQAYQVAGIYPLHHLSLAATAGAGIREFVGPGLRFVVVHGGDDFVLFPHHNFIAHAQVQLLEVIDIVQGCPLHRGSVDFSRLEGGSQAQDTSPGGPDN